LTSFNEENQNRPEPEKKCSICGKEYKEKTIKVLNRDRTIWVANCDCERKKEKNIFYKERGIKLKDKIIFIKKDCGIGKLYRDKTFSNFKATNKNLEKALSKVKDYALNFVRDYKERKDIKSLLISGSVGTGKTHLVAGIIDYLARLLKRQGVSIVFTTAINIIRQIKFSFDNRNFEETVEALQYPALLVIDDIGSEYGSEFAKEILFSIIDYRYSEMLPTVITTNLNLSTLRERAGNDRLISRLLEYDMLTIESKDYRGNEQEGLNR
jgi:DNA replication protein DnaC